MTTQEENGRHRAVDRLPRRMLDLAAIASSVLKPREDQHTVRYIAQIDVEDTMIKRTKVGPNTSVYVKLEGTALCVSKSKVEGTSKNRSSSARHRVNVRVTPVSVDVPRRELRIYVPSPGKDKLLRLVIPSKQCAVKWKNALENAVCSDITEYYTFGDTLGSGAYGEVVQAVHNISKEARAIKIIKRSDNMKSREHLDSEIQVMKSISHPNIVQTYQIFDLRRTIYIVMEYVPCGDLFDFVAQHECLTERQSSQTMRSIFKAVEYLHRNSIVHRDLKPENILCANDSWPLDIKVSDFGFANFLKPTKDSDDTMRTQVGTVYFMAPEIISNKGHGPAVDVWACGIMLYTILTGRLPFPGKNTTEYLSNVVRGKLLFPAVLWKGISDNAKSLVKALLNQDSNKRLTAMAALQHRWIAKPIVHGDNQIRRDRSNLHSRRRRLFKARKAVIAVAMANKFKATIPQMVDVVGDSTKKVAGAIETGVKKTTDGIEKGLGEIATSVISLGDGLAEGTKKVAGDIGEGTKKVALSMADGTKKVAGGIGSGVKKTKDGVETSARKVGEGVRKTADGFETGLKKTSHGIGQGVKMTADGISVGAKKAAGGVGQGVKKTTGGLERSVKVTSSTLKRGVERLRHERANGTDMSGSHCRTDSQSSSMRRSAGPTRSPFRRRVSNASKDIAGDGVVGMAQRAEDASSADEYMSALEDHSETEEGWGQTKRTPEYNGVNENSDYGNNVWIDRPIPHAAAFFANALASSANPFAASPANIPFTTPPPVDPIPVPSSSPFTLSPTNPFTSPPTTTFTNSAFSNGTTTTPMGTGTRPKLAPLSGLTMGLSDETMAGSSAREHRYAANAPFNGMEGRQADLLRKTAAALLMTSNS